MLYDESGERAGYATSYVYSPMLQAHIGIARVRPELAAPGTRLAWSRRSTTRTPLYQRP